LSRVFKAEIRMNSTKPETQIANRADAFKLMGAGAILLVALVAYYAFAAHSSSPWARVVGVIGLLLAAGMAAIVALKTELGAETLEFIRGSRSELRKVVWPTRAETTQTTLIVLAMVVVMGLLLWLLDVLLLWLVRLLTG